MRIYLSKSNQADFSVYNVVKQKLIKMGHQVIEHNSGTYDPSLILSCEVLVVLPGQHVLGEIQQMTPGKQASYADVADYEMGKGQFEQVVAFAKKTANVSIDNCDTPTYTFGKNNVYIVTEVEIVNGGEVTIRMDELDTLYVDGSDWKKHYATWVHMGMTWNIDHMEQFKVYPDNSVKLNESGEEVNTTQPHLALAPVFNIQL